MRASIPAVDNSAIIAAQLGILAIAVAGIMLMSGYRGLAGKMFLVGVFLAVVAGCTFVH